MGAAETRTPARGPDHADGVDEPDVHALELAFVVLAVVVSLVFRFVTRSPMWLDEALSVNIARLPVGDIFDALRHDGHPPLYYVVLHYWMEIFGEGDQAVRALSGVFSVATLPLAWLAGRRRGGEVGGALVLLVTAVAPFSLRYATEARMYSLVALLMLGAWLVADDLRSSPSRSRWLLLALLTGASLLTHYWAIYAGIAAVVLLAWRWWRADERAAALRVGSSLAAGVVCFLPWLGAFLYQAAHTGTPWGSAARPTQAVMELAVGIGGGAFPEGTLFGMTVLFAVAVGLLAVERGRSTMVLDLRTASTVRPEVALALLTLTVGLTAGALSGGAFIARYAAGLIALLFVAAGIGLSMLPRPWPLRVVVVGLVGLSAVGAAKNVTDSRTQGESIAEALNAAAAPGDVVAFCPDQIGPSTLRSLEPGVDAVAIPTLDRPDRIDWVDYGDRNRSADPSALATSLLERAGDGVVWLVFADGYRTYEELCIGVLTELTTQRPERSVAQSAKPVGEPSTLYRFDP
ncbi:glycosyltransferase family 39 protein [Actinospongicola halichondriae]|uniref:glycosyltransferase family 39 protein n=1 Tax=Actinospongicola halichondriae TaxID=3236844 RepID=UPI003D466C63